MQSAILSQTTIPRLLYIWDKTAGLTDWVSIEAQTPGHFCVFRNIPQKPCAMLSSLHLKVSSFLQKKVISVRVVCEHTVHYNSSQLPQITDTTMQFSNDQVTLPSQFSISLASQTPWPISTPTEMNSSDDNRPGALLYYSKGEGRALGHFGGHWPGPCCSKQMAFLSIWTITSCTSHVKYKTRQKNQSYSSLKQT